MSRKKSTKEYIEDAIQAHGDRYDYTLTVYDGKDKDITFLCRRCGLKCTQNAGNHIHQKQGCRACSYVDRGAARLLTRDAFIASARERHLDGYDYSYVTQDLPDGQFALVRLICNRCGRLIVKTAKAHLRGEGCKLCNLAPAAAARRRTFKRFLTQAHEAHGDAFDYSMVRGPHVATRSKIRIICRECVTPFEATVGSHLYLKEGCPRCSCQSSVREREWLDAHNVPVEGRHARIRGTRLKADAVVGNTVYEFYGAYYHGDPRHGPPEQYNSRSNKTYVELYDATIARQSMIEGLGYNVLFVWELDWLDGKLLSERHPMWP